MFSKHGDVHRAKHPGRAIERGHSLFYTDVRGAPRPRSRARLFYFSCVRVCSISRACGSFHVRIANGAGLAGRPRTFRLRRRRHRAPTRRCEPVRSWTAGHRGASGVGVGAARGGGGGAGRRVGRACPGPGRARACAHWLAADTPARRGGPAHGGGRRVRCHARGLARGFGGAAACARAGGRGFFRR